MYWVMYRHVFINDALDKEVKLAYLNCSIHKELVLCLVISDDTISRFGIERIT